MTITVIGVDGVTLPPGAASLLEEADLVVGGRRHLARHAPTTARTIELGPLTPALDAVAAQPPHAAVAVLASGDPGFFGIVRSLRSAGLNVAVLPAPSSVQRLAGMIGRSWDDLTVVSAHGRALRHALNVCRARPAVAVLCGPGAGPAEIAVGLRGWRRTLVVGEDLGGPEERLTMIGAPDLASPEVTGRAWREPNLLFSLADEKAVPPLGWIAGGEPLPPAEGWALPEDRFAHRDGMITKAEVRALVLARLAPRLGTLVWDVGAGSGSVAVECARLGAAVIAVERDPAQAERITVNATSHGVDVRVVHGDAPEALDGLPAPDAVFVGGGGPEVVAACADLGARRVVVALAALDRFAAARDVLREHGYRVDGCQLSASRLADLPNGTTRLAATNPVLIVWGEHGDDV